MVNRTPELDKFERDWARTNRRRQTHAQALAWYGEAIEHARRLAPGFGSKFTGDDEALRVLRSDIRLAAALNGLESLRSR